MYHPKNPEGAAPPLNQTLRAGTVTPVLTRNPARDPHKEVLDNFGISNKDMQRSFLSLRHNPSTAPHSPLRSVTVALSCVDVSETERDELKTKCNDIISAILAMNTQQTSLKVLMPVQLMLRHGFPHIPSNNQGEVIPILKKRLTAWADVLGLEPNALQPLLEGKVVPVHTPKTTLVFHPWTSPYITNALETRIDTLVSDTKALFNREYNASTPLPFLAFDETNNLRPLLLKAFSESIAEAELTQDLPEEIRESIINCVIFHTLLVIALRHRALEEHAEKLSKCKGGAQLAEDGTALLHKLNELTPQTMTNEFAHGLAFFMEEICSPEVLKKFADEYHVQVYIRKKELIRRTNPMRVIADNLKPAGSPANLETCNSYETQEQREAKRLGAQLAKSTPTKGTSPQQDDKDFLELAGQSMAFMARNGYLQSQGGQKQIDPDKMATFFTSLASGYFAPSNNSERNRSGSNNSGMSSGGNVSPSSARSGRSGSKSSNESGHSSDEEEFLLQKPNGKKAERK